MLSKVCIFDILSNDAWRLQYQQLVVNCFQKFVSLIFWATLLGCSLFRNQLWIAFKSLYLWYSEQQQPKPNNNGKCCELLSKVCIFDILSNENQQINKSCLVVNCFQKFVSLIFWATSVEYNYRIFELWIAFKSLYLWYSEQLRSSYRSNGRSCELLSKVCIFDILSNHQGESAFTIELWIAFKSLYLWYSEQHTTGTSNQDIRCELLSKVCIFDILSNGIHNRIYKQNVVNCFQKFVSLIFWATELH